jgi:hypothetical protein
MSQVSKNKINGYLLYKQHLLRDSGTDDIIQITRDLCGLHATCPTTPYLSLFARMNRFLKSDLVTEIEVKKSLIRTRSIRNTLHLLPVDTYLSVFAATRLQLERRTVQYIKNLGMTNDEFDFLADRIQIALSGRGLTASEIKNEIGNLRYINHVINILCDNLTIVRGKIKGSWKSNIHRYYRFEDFYSGIESGGCMDERAFEDLVMSYINTYGPVKENDIIWWSGLNRTMVRDVLKSNESKLTWLETGDFPGQFLVLTEDFNKLRQFRMQEDAVVHFLPAMDPYIMGYKERQRMIDAASSDYVFDRFGNASPVIVLNGQVIGIWDVADGKNQVMFFLFRQVHDEIYEKIIKAGVTVGRFYCDAEVDILEVRSVIPVKELTVGSFMSPLKNALKYD